MVAPPRRPPPPRSPAGSFVFPYCNKSERPNMMLKKKIHRVLRKGTFLHSPARRRPCWKGRPLGRSPQPLSPSTSALHFPSVPPQFEAFQRPLPPGSQSGSPEWPPGIGPLPDCNRRASSPLRARLAGLQPRRPCSSPCTPASPLLLLRAGRFTSSRSWSPPGLRSGDTCSGRASLTVLGTPCLIFLIALATS